MTGDADDPLANALIYHGTPMTPGVLERFWAKVSERAPEECWPWLGAVNHSGYGRFAERFKAPQRMATHVMLELHGKPRPTPTSQALHSCDNPPCVNPSHLYWGGYAENVADRISRGRSCGHKRSGALNGMYTKPESRLPGEKNPAAKLTAELVLAIIRDARKNVLIAGDYGVSSALIGQIKRGVSWRHIPRGQQ